MRLADPPKPAPVVISHSQDQHREDEAQDNPDEVVTAVPVLVAQPVHRKDLTSLTYEEAVRCLVPWWREVVPDFYRHDVMEEAKWQLTHFWPRFVIATTALTTEELFKQTRPSYTPEIAPEAINFCVAWLLGWCLALTRDLWCVSNLVVSSYKLAQK